MQLKRLLLFCLFLPAAANAAKIVSQQTGNWGDTTTWVGGVVPHSGDEVTIFHVISTTDTRAIGVSVSSGSVAVDLQSTGTIHVTLTGHLKVRGFATYTAGSGNTNDAVDVDGGGAWEFDTSLTTAPTSFGYSFYPSASAGYRKFKVSGSSTAYASLYSNNQSGQGKLAENGQADGGTYELLYASVTNMGFEVAYNNGSGSLEKWDARYSSFTHCGVINAGAGGNMFATALFRHENNWHGDTQGGYVFQFNFNNFNNGGTRSIQYNVFDAQMGNTLGLGDFTIQGNFMNAGYGAYFSSWSTLTDNFVRVPQTAVETIGGVMSDDYFWLDKDQQNPHILIATISSSTVMDKLIYGQSGRANNKPGDDAGEFYLQGTPGNISTYTVTNSIFLPDGSGYSALEITSLIGTASTASFTMNKAVIEHNTYFGGWDNSSKALPPFAALDYSETSNMAPGTIVSFRSNLLWNPQLANFPAQFFKALDVGNMSANQTIGYGTGPTLDVCAPANCDYNGAYVVLSTGTGTNIATYTNQGNGYVGRFSSTPGVHDVNNQNPNFVDYHRYVEGFDKSYWRPYFGQAQPNQWASGNTYNDGDTVAHSTGTLYWGDTINYVHVSTGFCVGNPEPGAYPLAAWQKCWQFASIKDIQTAIVSSTTFTDSVIGVTNSDVIHTINQWIRSGYAPLNAAYKGKAHDGGDIGAEPVGTAGFPLISPSTPVAIVGGSVQFVSTSAVTWSLTAGSMGSISASGLYTAPTTYFAANNLSQQSGCMLRPNDDIVNTRIDALPVDSSSTARFNRLATVLGGGKITFQPTMPTNLYSNGTPISSMTFRSTSGANGNFPLLPLPYRAVENSNIPNNPVPLLSGQDYHILGVSSSTCFSSEMYGYYPYGDDPGAPGSNSQSGFQYYTNLYSLPDTTTGAGGTDAAGMAIQPLLLRYSELRKGAINHALRMTLNNGDLYSGFLWPATDSTNQQSDPAINFPYGSRVRLKAGYSCPTISPAQLAVCNALKQYGAFITDGGTALAIATHWDATEDTTTWKALFTDAVNTSSMAVTDLEQVDETSLMVSTASGKVNLSNPYVTPVNFAEAKATNVIDGSTNTVRIALQTATAGFANPAFQEIDTGINVMSGTPQFQVPYWINGATDTTASCTMSPSVGTLTSDCKYTAPASQYNQVIVTTVTITPTIAPALAISFPLVVFSSDAIRMREGPSNSADDTTPPYNANGDYTDSFGNVWFQETANSLPGNFYTRDTQGSLLWPGADPQINNARDYGSGDKVFAAMVPNGPYILAPSFATSCVGCGEVTASTNSLESQGTVYASSVSLVASAFIPKTYPSVVRITNNQFYWAIRGNKINNNVFISYWSLVPTVFPAQTEIWNGVILMKGKITFK